VALAIETVVSVQLPVAVTDKGSVLLFCNVGGKHVGAPGGAATAMLSVWLAVVNLASVTCTEKLKVPAVVGVPEITPDELKLVPGGSGVLDERDHAYGKVPPVACNVVGL
jgi:hypothetical protein